MSVTDRSLARVEDITEEERDITLPSGVPSTISTSTSSSEYESMASRLLRWRSRGYRKRLSRSREEISASSRSTESAQTAADNADSDDDSLASVNVFGSQAEQIKFLKDSLLQYNKELENYKIVNADLTRKLEKCKKRGREVEKMLENALWDKLKLLNKYKRLQRRFDVPETPPGEEDSSLGSDSSGAPGNAGRAGTPVRRHRKRRGDSPAGHQNQPGPSKVRPTVMRCGLDREVMDSASNASSADESSDTGFSMVDISHSAKSCYESDADGSSSRSDSQCSLQSALVDQNVSNNPDPSNDDQSENDDVPSHVSLSECSLQSALIDQDISNNPDPSNDAQSENDVPSHVPETPVHDDEILNDGNRDPEPNTEGALHDKEEDDVYSRGSCRTSASEEDERDSDGKVDEERSAQSSESGSSFSRKRPRSSSSGNEEKDIGEESPKEEESDSSSSSNSRKRKSSTSLSSGAGSKRTKSSSSSSDTSGTDSSSDSSSDRSSLPPRRSRSPSPPLPFRDAPGVIPGAPIPAGTGKLPRYWHRDGNNAFDSG